MRLNVLKNHVPIHDVRVATPDLQERYEIFFGRSEDCHVRVEDPLISRHHFVIRNESGTWWVEKLSNLGNIVLKGSSDSKMRLDDGDEIKCGPYSVFISEIPKPETPAPVAPAYIQEMQPEAPVSAPRPTMTMTAPMEEKKNLAPVSEMEDALDVLDEKPQTTSGLSTEGFNLDQDNSQSEEGDFNGDNALVESDFGDGELTESLGSVDVGEKTQFFKAFVNYQLVLFGENAPYDRYLIDSDEVFIGRDAKKCQILLDDPEVSSVHAVLRKNNNDVMIEDLNSSNGTILNGERINKAQIFTGDEFLIGSTSFKLETRSDLLEAESDRLMPVESGQFVETEEIEEELVDNSDGDVDFNSEVIQEKSIVKRIWKDPAKRKKLIYGLVAVSLAWVLLGDEEKNVPVEDPNKAKVAAAKKDEKPKIQLSKEQEEIRNQAYELGINFFDQEKHIEAETEFHKVMQIDPNYKKVRDYLEQTIESLKRIKQLAAEELAEKERIALKKFIEELVTKAREAVKERQVAVAESVFSQIIEKDPENIDVQQMRLELDAWVAEEKRKADEISAKQRIRQEMVNALLPGKTHYIKREWYKAYLRLEDYLKRKKTDEDLLKEASDMMTDAKAQLAAELGPLLGKARSLKEGQDLKSAYEAFLEVLKIEPTNAEALNEIDDIKSMLETRSKRIYREAIIAESLSLFSDAKEKFQEVQQISPTDSEYYRKANDKLKNYLE